MVKTNKERLVRNAVQGEVMPAVVERAYITTWDGRPKMAIGVGGINYNVKLGDYVFGWATSDRLEPGVATDNTGNEAFRGAFRSFSSIGNEVRVIGGEGKGAKGVVIGKHGYLPGGAHHVLVHLEDNVLEKLAIGDKILVKAAGTGLTIEGFDDVKVMSLGPELLDKMGIKESGNQLEVPVAKEIPHDITGMGPGGSPADQSNWHIQTSYPPDISQYGLDDMRFGDVVLLKNIQSDYGRGYYTGGATVGVVSSGPSEISGLGIGVTAVLSTRFNKIKGKIDPAANIAKYLGIKVRESPKPSVTDYTQPKTLAPRSTVRELKTNKDKLIVSAVQGVVQPPGVRQGYRVTYDGKPKMAVGTASIVYNVSVGDSTYGWASADHVEPDVTIQGRDRPVASDCALAILACIGNEATVVSGEAKGAKGIFIGRHAGADDMVWFPPEVTDKLALEDKIQIKTCGVGLKIEGFEDVRVNKVSPAFLEKLGIMIEGNQLVVPIAMDVPGYIMGSGMGGSSIETVDYDIQTTCPDAIEKLGLEKLRLGDIVAIRDHYDYWGRGRYKDAVTIGVVIHGFSDFAGHGPGVNPILSALPGRIKTKIDPSANTSYILGIRKKPS